MTTYFYRYKNEANDKEMTNNNKKTIYKLDDTEILHVLAAIEFRIDYYTKRIEAIENIKDRLGSGYSSNLKDAEMSKDYHIGLRDNLTSQQTKNEKLGRVNKKMMQEREIDSQNE